MAKAKILVVEDEAITAKDLQDELRGLGYDAPAIASSGEGAIKKAEEIKPDLVLMDIVLKGDMDGIEAAERICDLFDIPVVYVTAYLDEERLEKTKVTEPYGYIIKPFGDKDLRPVIEMALQRHKLEKALRESEEKYRTFIEMTSEGYWVLDHEHKTVEVNQALCDMLGYTRAEILGKSPHDFVDDDNLKIFKYQMGKIESTLHRSYEITLKKKSGEDVAAWFNATTVRDDTGEFKGAYALVTDITERKQMEEKQSLFSHAVDSSIDGLAMGDLEGRITYVNDAFVRMFGYSREELIGAEIGFIYSEDQLPKLEEALNATMDGGWVGELVGRRKDGELFPVAISSSLIKDGEGNVIAHMASHQDISERKRVENELKKKNKELELFNRLAVGRELKMIELKKEINALLEDLGKEPRYEIAGEEDKKNYEL
jgi:PAS domain S-box-containing protein